MKSVPTMDEKGNLSRPLSFEVPEGLTQSEVSAYLYAKTDTTRYKGTDTKRILRAYYGIRTYRSLYRANASLRQKGLL